MTATVLTRLAPLLLQPKLLHADSLGVLGQPSCPTPLGGLAARSEVLQVGPLGNRCACHNLQRCCGLLIEDL